MKKLIWLFAACVTAAFGGCTQKEASLKIAAASDLTLAFQEVAEQFEQKTGVSVSLSFGSTGQWAKQIENGAPFDVLAAANVQTIEDLNKQKLIVPETARVYAFGSIVIAAKDGSIRTFRDLLREDVKKIAIANPAHAPYGLAAKQALERAGVWKEVNEKIVYAKNVADALAYVESGNAEAGIVAYSLVKTRDVHFSLIDKALHEPIKQAAAVLKTAKHRKEAAQFVEFLHSRDGQTIMAKYGFTVTKEN